MSGGMDELYKEFENVPNTNQKEVDMEKIYNKTITTGKDINLITDIPDSYSMTVLETIADYLERKYKGDKYIKVVIFPVKQFCKRYKELNPAVNGKRVTDLFSSLSQFVQYVKNRTTVQRLTNTDVNKNE